MMDWHLYKNFTISRNEGICRVVLNVLHRPVNVLTHEVMLELEKIVTDLENDTESRVVTFESDKESGFLAGADVAVIQSIESAEQAGRLLSQGQELFQRIEWLPQKTIAVVHGPCLGGGLELALACDYRIARDNPSTKMGLPEIKLGLIPGWGGTQRLPKLVGLTNSLSMILKGSMLNAGAAFAKGLIDLAASPDDWETARERFINSVLHGEMPKRGRRRRLRTWLLEGTAIGRNIVLTATRKQIRSRVDHFPALESAIQAVADSFKASTDGFATERREFTKLLATPTCRNLLQLFFAREAARNPKAWSPGETQVIHENPIRTVGVVGAGAMGAGIGMLAATRGYGVCLKEIDAAAVEAGNTRMEQLAESYAKHKGLAGEQLARLRERFSVTDDADRLSQTDLVVEAVIERMEVKKLVFAELEKVVSPSTVLATNTSSLSVAEMAETLERPGNFAGLHFFNPVHKMELVEVVRGPKTSEATIARLVGFVRALGKTPIVTEDSPGFLVNRILFPYLGEAVLMAGEGYDIKQVDREIRRFGMPMGPFELLDHVGLDVASHVAGGLRGVMHDAEPVQKMLAEMVGRGELGRKSKRGFYDYRGKQRVPSSSLVASKRVMPAPVPSDLPPGDLPSDSLTSIQRRLVYPMLREAVVCWQDKVVEHAWAIDVAMVLGTGFAPHLGGPLTLIDSIGSHRVLGNMRLMRAMHGNRFKPPRRLIEMADSGVAFVNKPAASSV